MLIGILAATGLGLAMLSGQQSGRREETLSMGRRQLEDKDKGVEGLISEQQRQLRSLEVPSLWETFEIVSDNLYVVFIADDSVTDVHDTRQEAIISAEYRSEEEGTERVYVDHIRFVPWGLQQRLFSYSEGEGGFADGYDAANGIAMAGGDCPQMQRKVTWRWNMYEDEPYENWNSEAQSQYRGDIVEEHTEGRTVPAGLTLFHATDEPNAWEDTDELHPWDFWLFEDADEAIAFMKEQSAVKTRVLKKKRGPPRLLTFKTTDLLYLLHIGPNVQAIFETVFELDLDDADDVEKNVLAFPEYSGLEGLMFGEPGRYKISLDDETLENILKLVGRKAL